MSDAWRPPWRDEERRRQFALRPSWTIEEAARTCCWLRPDVIPKYRRKYYEQTLRVLDKAARRGVLKTAWDVAGEADPGAAPGEVRWHLEFVPRDVFLFALHTFRPTGSPLPGQPFPYGAEEFPVAAIDLATLGALLDIALAPASSPPAAIGAVDASRDRAPADRKALVDRFIERVLEETGQKITRTDIWRVTGYSEATEFERWQRRDVGYEDGSGVDQKLRRVLSLVPAEFIRRLERRRLVVKVIPPSPA